jgi:hypothetical protein
VQLEAPADGGGGAPERLLAGVLPHAPLLRALATCTAAEATCRIVPLGPLPAGPVRCARAPGAELLARVCSGAGVDVRTLLIVSQLPGQRGPLAALALRLAPPAPIPKHPGRELAAEQAGVV